MPYLRPNTDAAFGFIPADGDKARVTQYEHATTDPGVFAGDAVKMTSAGQVTSVTAATDIIVGVAAETLVTASGTAFINVYDDPDQRFLVQEDSVGTAMSQTLIGNLFDINNFLPTTSAQVTRGRSIQQLDTSTTITSPAGGKGQLKLVAMSGIESSFPSASGSPRKVIVSISPFFHFYATASGV